MKSIKVLVSTLLLIIIVLVLLKITGLISISFIEFLSYLLLLGGFTLWFSSFNSENKGGIFTGGFIFFSGVVLAVESFFTIWNPSRMIFPSVFIISGLSTFFIYLSDKRKIIFLVLSLLLVSLGFIYLFDRINFKPEVFISAIWKLILNLWLVIIISGIIIYFFISHSNKN